MAFCREVATRMTLEDFDSKVDMKRLEHLRKQAAQMTQACKLPEGSLATPLLEAALGSLESATGMESQGEIRYGKAAKILAQIFRNDQRRLGAGHPSLLPDLEALALLYRLGGLRGAHWRDEALRIRVQRSQVPDPILEKDLAVAVEDHYGPWLTPVELEPMLEFCGHLARTWSRNRSDKELTRRVLDVGLKSNATRVWRLAARKAADSLREDLASLLRRLDPAASPRAPEAFVELGEALLKTPLESQAKALLKRVDASGIPSPLRRRIARLLEDWEMEAGLLEAELKQASPENAGSLLTASVELLKEHPNEGLLAEGTRKVKAMAALNAPPEDLPQILEQWMDLQDNREEAEELLRLRLALVDGKDIRGRCALLAHLGRWQELEALLGSAEPPDLMGVFWHFRAAMGLGRIQEAHRWIEVWADRALESSDLTATFPGLAQSIPLFQDLPEPLTKLATRLGPGLLPGQERLLSREPWHILAALDPESNLLPSNAEESLRWRLDRLPPAPRRFRVLHALLTEAEGRLGSSHPLVAEILLVLGKDEDLDGIPELERALAILEKEPEAHASLLAQACTALAGARTLTGDRKGLERDSLRLLEILEGLPQSQDDALNLAKEGTPFLLMYFYREQNFDALSTLAPRVQALAKRAPKPEGELSLGPDTPELGEALSAMGRLSRLQAQLKGAGLP